MQATLRWVGWKGNCKKSKVIKMLSKLTKMLSKLTKIPWVELHIVHVF